MKLCTTVALLLALAAPASAGVIWDETINGDLSTSAALPTPLAFAPGGNTIIGTVANSNGVGGDRDFITFTIGPAQTLLGLNLIAYAPDNLSFLAFNSGTTSFVPSAATNASFLAGIHVGAADVGTNLMPDFVTRSVTTNALATPVLGPGNYCFIIQQTTNIVQSYALEFVVDGPVPAKDRTWGAIQALYR